MTRPEVHPGITSLAEEWDELADRAGASPFLRPGWFAAWYDAFGAGNDLEVLALRRGPELVAVLPVLCKPPRRYLSPTNAHTPEFGLLAADDEAAGDLAAALIARRPTAIDLSFAARDDALVRALAESRYDVVATEQAQSPWIDTTGIWADYCDGLPSKFRREARRRYRRLEETEGEVSFQFVGAGDDVDALLAEGFAIEGSGWKVEEGTAIASQPETERFYREVAHWAAQKGWLQLAFLRVGGRAAAFDLNLWTGERVYVLKGGYDADLKRYAPRTLLTLETLERSFARPEVRSYEFLGAAEPYKLELTDLTRERVRVQAFSPAPLGAAQRFAWRCARPAARAVRNCLRPATTRVPSRRTA